MQTRTAPPNVLPDQIKNHVSTTTNFITLIPRYLSNEGSAVRKIAEYPLISRKIMSLSRLLQGFRGWVVGDVTVIINGDLVAPVFLETGDMFDGEVFPHERFACYCHNLENLAQAKASHAKFPNKETLLALVKSRQAFKNAGVADVADKILMNVASALPTRLTFAQSNGQDLNIVVPSKAELVPAATNNDKKITGGAHQVARSKLIWAVEFHDGEITHLPAPDELEMVNDVEAIEHGPAIQKSRLVVNKYDSIHRIVRRAQA
jgi:hypothetical protein